MFSRSLSSLGCVLGGFAAAAGVLAPVRACGPDFPNAYLVSTAEELAALPTLSFPAELARLLPPATTMPPLGAKEEKSSSAAEMAEARAVLAAKGLEGEALDAVANRYCREDPPAELPAEFHLYAKGARAWHAGKIDEAVAAWRALLALPEKERIHRTVWAAYMVGRALGETDERAAFRSLQLARQAAANGFTDIVDLASASLGWEAKIHFEKGDYPAALKLYFQQFAAGEPSSVVSMQLVLQKLFRADAEGGSKRETNRTLSRLAKDRELRGIVTAWFAARGGEYAPWSAKATEDFRRWLSSLPRNGKLGPVEADRWAWAAYQNGMWEEAEAFAREAAPEAAASEWVRAMLLLRQGNFEQAMTHLAGAARAFPQDSGLSAPIFLTDDYRFYSTHEDVPAAQLAGVRGVLALQREQYIEALRLFFQAGHWADSAYLAERVLTVEELTGFITAEVPAPKPAKKNENGDVETTREDQLARDLRALLARRLVRSGQFDQAREYFSGELVETYDRYVRDVRQGYRADLARPLRAAAMWEAAQIARDSGLELQGTELAPDYAIWGGGFQWPDTEHQRSEVDGVSARYRWADHDEKNEFRLLMLATQGEAMRTSATQLPTRRYHYRYRAAELAMLAATLLPDDDEQAAEILNTAGRWIAPQDPEGAQLFYKTLVFRCAKTAIGRAAAERRWFVPPEELPKKEPNE